MSITRVTDLQRRALRLISSGRWVLDPTTGGAHNPATPGRLLIGARTLGSLRRRGLVAQGEPENDTALRLTDSGQITSGLAARSEAAATPEEESFLPLADMEPRRLYRIRSRNLVVGVWNPDTNGFLGIREKFGDRYVFTEFHHETGAPYGTVWPLEALDAVLPDSVDLRELLGSECSTCRVPVSFDKTREPSDRWAHDTATDCDRVSPVAVANTALFDWLDPYDRAEDARLAASRESH